MVKYVARCACLVVGMGRDLALLPCYRAHLVALNSLLILCLRGSTRSAIHTLALLIFYTGRPWRELYADLRRLRVMVNIETPKRGYRVYPETWLDKHEVDLLKLHKESSRAIDSIILYYTIGAIVCIYRGAVTNEWFSVNMLP
jgi:hypothetical protein